MVNQSQFIEKFGPSSNWPKEELYKNVEEMFIGPFGSSLKNDCFVEKEKGYCVVYEQKHAIEKSIELPFRYVTHDKYQELKRFEVLPGDIIVSCRGTVGEVYRIPDNAPRGIMHPSIMKIRLKKESFCSEYFVFAVAEYMKDRESKNLGTGVKMAVTATDMGKELFTKPSVTEQNSFISIIHHADKSKFAGFKSQFIEMFRAAPKEHVHLKDVATYSIGLTYKPDNVKPTGIPVLRSGNIQEESLDFGDLVRVDSSIPDTLLLRDGDILMCSRNGSSHLVGKVARIRELPEPMTYGAFMTVIRSEYMDYLFLFFQSDGFRQQISYGKSSTMNQITQKMLDQITLDLPSKAEIGRLSPLLEQADKSKFELKQAIEKIDKVMRALIQ